MVNSSGLEGLGFMVSASHHAEPNNGYTYSDSSFAFCHDLDLLLCGQDFSHVISLALIAGDVV